MLFRMHVEFRSYVCLFRVELLLTVFQRNLGPGQAGSLKQQVQTGRFRVCSSSLLADIPDTVGFKEAKKEKLIYK